MDHRPVVVGFTLRPQRAENTPPRYVQNRRYLDGLLAAGAVPLGIPAVGDERVLRTLYDRCDALLLPGGPDVEPSRYGEETRAGCDVSPVPELDAAEFPLARWALEEGRPLLAICRGIQVLNVALGGTLWQDIAVQHAGDPAHHGKDRTAPAHQVSVVAGTALHRVVGADRLAWNSLHHQALRDLGDGLVASAVADDGLVEGVELPDRPVLGVQCHPEEMAPSQGWAAALFGWLVAAAQARSGSGSPA
ncbi:MAG TPA: gamma-glutamyl-gamma-aminobutyrate hydrolase family protein [Candidatus Angelobacter sp.]|jgi:putative glutamine amidotransferase|nr:gamma-glutamyl-gamma-aminobutyrate hydrolase family protein [Candidatus Angelobacter sp.]